MGLYDSFYDEDSECTECHAKIRSDWQTKSLDSFMGSWQKGDFLQYHKYELIPEEERKREFGNRAFAPIMRKTEDHRSDAPLLFNAKVPVYTSCENCKTWLEAYAKIIAGRFVGIVEAEVDGKEKQLVVIGLDAKTLRAEFERNLSHLQESCKHEEAEWTNAGSGHGRSFEKRLVCPKCEKVLNNEKQ